MTSAVQTSSLNNTKINHIYSILDCGLVMVAAGSSATPITNDKITPCHNPEDHILNQWFSTIWCLWHTWDTNFFFVAHWN
jgi:hypothetical protein